MKKKFSITTRELVIFAFLGAIMFGSTFVMQFLPNIHLLGTLIVTYTIVYRAKALIPIYLYAILNGLLYGYTPWWIPNLYIWTVLWAVTMILPRNMPRKVKLIVYPIVSGLHGLAYGLMYSPIQAIMMGLDIKGTIAWLVAGLPFDAIHGAGNFVLGFLILPLSALLIKLESGRIRT